MKRFFLAAILLLALQAPALAEKLVLIETSMGNIKVSLDEEKAPATVSNFLKYADEGFYNGTIFHRVIKDFMIQGGGYDTSLNEKPTRAPIRNEAGNGLLNDRGTIAMARTNVVDSATAQFFINLKNNDFLNHRDETARGFGYAVFGKVVSGMEVVDAIANAKTLKKGLQFQDIPETQVVIKRIARIEK